MLDAFAAAAQQAGIPPSDDFNRGDNEGVGYFEVNQRAGMRWNATKAFLRPVVRRPNLQVWTGAHIDRVLLDAERRATRRRASRRLGGGAPRRRRLAPGGEVILATGAIGTPQILQLSGIGPPALLRAHGIAVAAASCPASARTCRTTCRSARSSASRARRRSTRWRPRPGARR